MPLTPKNRKEEWLEGLVDHETTLSPKNRCEAWMKEIIDASGGGGGTGGGVLKVNVEQGQMDKTYAEIKAAFMEGIVFYIYPNADGDSLCIATNCYDGEEGCYLQLTNMFGGNNFTFECQTVNDYPVATHG